MPLNAEAVVIIRQQLGTHANARVQIRGKPITQVSTKAWYAALERAGIDDFRWHDLRYTLGELAGAAGTPLHALQGS